MGNSTAARGSRKGQAEADPRAQGNTEGPVARLPASDLAPASATIEQRRQRATSPIFSPERASPQGDQGLSPRARIDLILGIDGESDIRANQVGGVCATATGWHARMRSRAPAF